MVEGSGQSREPWGNGVMGVTCKKRPGNFDIMKTRSCNIKGVKKVRSAQTLFS